jgi:hypothetical protein
MQKKAKSLGSENRTLDHLIIALVPLQSNALPSELNPEHAVLVTLMFLYAVLFELVLVDTARCKAATQRCQPLNPLSSPSLLPPAPSGLLRPQSIPKSPIESSNESTPSPPWGRSRAASAARRARAWRAAATPPTERRAGKTTTTKTAAAPTCCPSRSPLPTPEASTRRRTLTTTSPPVRIVVAFDGDRSVETLDANAAKQPPLERSLPLTRSFASCCWSTLRCQFVDNKTTHQNPPYRVVL